MAIGLSHAAIAVADRHVEVRAELGDGWRSDSALAPPDSTAEAPRTEWRALRKGDARFATACFEAPLAHGWPADEAEPLALDKLAQIAAQTATRATGTEVTWRVANTDHGEITVARSLDADAAHARVLLGFRADRAALVACYAVCVGSPCDAPLAKAALFGPLGPAPPPSAATRLIVWSVHHPADTGGSLAFGAVALGALAVRARRRPR